MVKCDVCGDTDGYPYSKEGDETFCNTCHWHYLRNLPASEQIDRLLHDYSYNTCGIYYGEKCTCEAGRIAELVRKLED